MLKKVIFVFISMLQIQAAFGKSYRDFLLEPATSTLSKKPLVVWLHGCTQSSKVILELTQIQKVTESVEPYIYTPEQKLSSNPIKCWNWYFASVQERGAYLDSMVDEIRGLIAKGSVDADRVFVGGFSAGAVLAAHLAFCYPDVFSGALIHSGAPFQVIKGLRQGADKLGEYAYNCARPKLSENKLKRVVVFNGTRDHIAPFAEGFKVVKQAYDYFDLLDDQTKNSSMYLSSRERADGFDIYLKNDLQVHYFAIQDMKHAWSGGREGVLFSSPKTLSATQVFFDLTNHFGQW